MKSCTLAPALSRFSVQAFAAGMMSFLGHSPTFVVRDFSGTIGFPRDTAASLQLEMKINAAGLQLMDKVRAADREEIESRMRSEVLEIQAFPEISFAATSVSADSTGQGRYQVVLHGHLSLHGVAAPHWLTAELAVYDDGVRLAGQDRLRMSEYGIRPVTALAGAIRLKDELKLTFDLAAENV